MLNNIVHWFIYFVIISIIIILGRNLAFSEYKNEQRWIRERIMKAEESQAESLKSIDTSLKVIVEKIGEIK